MVKKYMVDALQVQAMERRHLRYFAAVVDAGNVSRAARRLHVAQPALSRQIQDLERDLACRLFDRIGRRVILTRVGSELLQRTRRPLADAEALRERAKLWVVDKLEYSGSGRRRSS